jgi:hypothetical protein
MEYELFKIRINYIINIMSKQILSEEFRRMQKLAGLLTESADIMRDVNIQSLKKELSKAGLKSGTFKLIDKDGKEHEMSIDDNGNITQTDINEVSIKNKLVTGITCAMLGAGMVSCTPEDTAGFGYNVSSRSTEYKLDKGTPNKKITITTPMGDEEHEVDSNMGDTKFYGGGQGLKFGRPLTPTEAVIIKIGHTYQTEKGMNNKKGTPANTRWDYHPKNSDITGGGTMYQDNKTPFSDAHSHPLWKLGTKAIEAEDPNALEFLKMNGLPADIGSVLRKAEEEVQKKDYIKENEMDANEELSEAYVPDNIKKFAKEKGVSALVSKIAGWAERAGKGIRGGTAIGKNYSTLILDLSYQDGAIRINLDNDTVEVYGEEVNNFNEFKSALANQSMNEMDPNDPVMMKLRAKKDAKPTTIPTAKAPNPNQSKIDQLKKHRADIIRDMEQEAELEGGPIADEYADKLRMIDIALRKLKA